MFSNLYHCFQPIRRINNLEIFGWEALLRGPDSPTKLFMEAEKNGMSIVLDMLSQTQALKTMNENNFRGKRFINCNLCTFTNDKSLLNRLHELPQKESIVIEITEGQRFYECDRSKIRYTIKELKRIGVKIAIDDFGSGYSNLFLIDYLEPDYIKTDRSLITNIMDKGKQFTLMKAIAKLGREMNVIIIAEGIENEIQKELLLDCGIELGQGWLFDPPIERNNTKEFK
ncbi:hypothetical protein BHU72_13390 [Desulfuribacillus stibiiarsenatis]|uniref:EAL domain-containing protein n=1 Tax=Desulfuribacillus stibiiarsenatis TaxID=1390249 RepID=A0A1E5L8L9_9FIRM|nr:EAL domain-containing protein [Desulfuribacillus stibiiarsenatis]OEH86408.1 hypothetical protein BHU72_13390 [Desulfuribacillus stibiiarsenatis]